jgi:single-strand DNA-binding protein
MADLNSVFLIGNLTRDPEVRYAPSGDAVADIQMAVNRKFRTKDGQDREEACFVGVVVWGRQAETCGQYLRKGSLVFVEGRLQYEQWEKDGQKNSRLRVRANRVQFLGSPRAGGGGSGEPSRGRGGAAAPSEEGEGAVGGPAEDGPPPAAAGGDADNLPF